MKFRVENMHLGEVETRGIFLYEIEMLCGFA